MIDRRKLARDNRRLAESAGQMLDTLIINGRREVKRIIISAIIAQVGLRVRGEVTDER